MRIMRDKLIQSRAAKWGLFISFVAVFALISGLYLPGCSNNPATSSETTASQDQTNFFDLPFDEAAFAKILEDPNVNVEVLSAEELCTVEDGGTISVGTAGNFYEFLLLPYTLETDVIVTMEIIKVETKPSGQVRVIYDFSPDGLVFPVPAILWVDVAKVLGKRATCADLYYLNEQTGQWEFQGRYCVDPVTEKVGFPIEHFSKYGIA
jgi:hypothetical protein